MHAHPGALAIPAACSVRTFPNLRRQRSAAPYVFPWLMASGHIPRTQKELFQKITVWGGTYGLISQTNYWCYLYRSMVDPAPNITLWASSYDAAEKPC